MPFPYQDNQQNKPLNQMNKNIQQNQVNPNNKKANHVNNLGIPLNQLNQLNHANQLNQVNALNQLKLVNQMSQLAQVNQMSEMSLVNSVANFNSQLQLNKGIPTQTTSQVVVAEDTNCFWLDESEKLKHFEEVYNLGKKLGSGSTCEVFQCKDRRTGATWAAKIVIKKGNRQNVMSEIGVLLKLEHPNIIRLKEVFETPTVMYIILELVSGGELFDRIVERGFYAEKDAAKCITQVLEGLNYMHNKDYVHRDIKPENLLYANSREDSVLKIADFGLAKLSNNSIMLKTVCGTPGYCAPEVLKEIKYSKAVDMWSVGVVCYILLCGYEPFHDKKEVNVYRKILKCEYSFHDEWWQNISLTAKDLISRLLVLNPKRRLTAAQALKHPWIMGTNITDATSAPRTQHHEYKKVKKANKGSDEDSGNSGIEDKF